MKNEITIPSRVKKTAPKPTKAQIVEALLERARTQFCELQEKNSLKQEEIDLQIKEEALAVLNSGMKFEDFEFTSDRAYKEGCEVGTLVSNPKIKRLLKKRESLEVGWFREHEVLKKIKAGMKPKNPLIDNSNVQEALDEMLRQIMAPESKKKTIEV